MSLSYISYSASSGGGEDPGPYSSTEYGARVRSPVRSSILRSQSGVRSGLKHRTPDWSAEFESGVRYGARVSDPGPESAPDSNSGLSTGFESGEDSVLGRIKVPEPGKHKEEEAFAEVWNPSPEFGNPSPELGTLSPEF